MEVRTAKAEGAHGCATRHAGPREPGTLFGRDVERGRAGGDLFLRRLNLDGGWNHLVVQRERGLDQPGGSCGSLGVADLRLHRAEAAPGIFRLAVHFAQRAHFDRVAHLGAGAVRLEKADALGSDPRVFIGVSERFLLTRRARGVNRVPFAVAGGADAADHGIDPVAVALRVA